MIFLSPMIQCHTELSPTSGVTWSSSTTTVLPSEEILFPLFQLSNNIIRTQIYGSMMRKICSHHYKQQNTSKWLIREATQITLTQNVTHYCLNCTHVNYTRLLARLYTTLKLVFHYQIRYDTIPDAILMCARKPTWVSLIYRTEPTTDISNKCWYEQTKISVLHRIFGTGKLRQLGYSVHVN